MVAVEAAKQYKEETTLQPLPLEFKTYRITVMRTVKTKIRKNTWVAWSEDEIELLKKLFPSGGAREIVEQIGRPLIAVRQKAYGMGIKTRGNRLWSADEVRLLKKLYPNEIVRSIAEKLGRSYRAVGFKARTIGLKKEKYPLWSNQEIRLLKKMYPDNSARDIANKLGRTVLAVQLKAYKVGLKKRFRYEDCHRVVNGAKEKLCRKCRKWQSESQFSKNRSSKDGLLGWCRKCLSAVRKKRRPATKN